MPVKEFLYGFPALLRKRITYNFVTSAFVICGLAIAVFEYFEVKKQYQLDRTLQRIEGAENQRISKLRYQFLSVYWSLPGFRQVLDEKIPVSPSDQKMMTQAFEELYNTSYGKDRFSIDLIQIVDSADNLIQCVELELCDPGIVRTYLTKNYSGTLCTFRPSYEKLASSIEKPKFNDFISCP